MAKKTADSVLEAPVTDVPYVAPFAPEALQAQERQVNNIGTVTEPLAKPEAVGTISASESLEIRTRNELITDLEKKINQDFRVLSLLRNEKLSYVRSILLAKEFDLRNNYSIDDSSGVITMTSRNLVAESGVSE